MTYATPTITIPSGASVMLDGETSSLEKLKAGDHVSISSSSDGTSVFATDSSFKPGEGHGPMGGPPPGGQPPSQARPRRVSAAAARGTVTGVSGTRAACKPPRRAGAMPVENRVAIGVGALALVAGVAVLALASGTGATIAAAMLLGIAGIAFVSLVFLIVGQSEEDDRRRHPRG